MPITKYNASDFYYYRRNSDGVANAGNVSYTFLAAYTYIIVSVITSGSSTGVFDVYTVNSDGDEIKIGLKDLLTNQDVTQISVLASSAKSFLLLHPAVYGIKLVEADTGFDGVLVIEGKRDNV